MSSNIICIGSALIDELFFCEDNPILGTSNPARTIKKPGGVMTNIARHLAMLNKQVTYLTALGNDEEAYWLKNQLKEDGISMEHIRNVEEVTGKYLSILNPDGSLFTAACADSCARFIDTQYLIDKKEILKEAELIITDTNIDSSTLQWLIEFCNEHELILIVEPVSVAKAAKLRNIPINGLFMITPNEDELQALSIEIGINVNDIVTELLTTGLKYIWLRKGSDGSVLYSKELTISLPACSVAVTDSTGAGDAALAGWISAFTNNADLNYCLKTGHALAYEVLQIKGAVLPELTPEKLNLIINKYYPNEK